MMERVHKTTRAARAMRRTVPILGALALLAATVHAQIPEEISYQAYLTDAGGVPITSAGVVVELDIYDAPTGGTLLDSFASGPLDLGLTQGFVNLLVPVNLTGEELNDELWLEVTVDGEPLDPRQKLLSSPQALNAARLEGLPASSFVVDGTTQTVAGEKTFSDIFRVEPGAVSTNASGEIGAGLSVRTTVDPDAWRAIGVRGRVSQQGPEPAGSPPSPLTARQIQGVVGAVSGEGGTNTTLGGGYFNARLLSSATDGAETVTGVSADAQIDSGATTLTGQLVVGGRFGASTANADPVFSIGTLGTSIATGGQTGPSTGVMGYSAGSVGPNTGVVGVTHTDLADLPIALIALVPTEGVGVLAYSDNPGGIAMRATAGDPGATALRVDGTSVIEGAVGVTGGVDVTGTVTSTNAPVNPQDLVRKDYVDDAFANMGRVLWVVPSGGAPTPDGTLVAPFDDIAAAYAAAQTMGPNFFNRVAIMLAPGQHTLGSTLDMSTVGIDLIGFGERSVFVNSSADPAIIMSAPTSGAVIRNLNLQAPSGSTNVLVEMYGGRLADVALRRSGGGDTLLVIDNAGSSISVRGFEIYGDVAIGEFAPQTTFTDGFVSGEVSVTGDGGFTDILFFNRMSGVGSFDLSPPVGAQIILSSVDLVTGMNYNTNTAVRASNVSFLNPNTLVPLALPDPAGGSILTSVTADTSAWTATTPSTANVGSPFFYNVFLGK